MAIQRKHNMEAYIKRPNIKRPNPVEDKHVKLPVRNATDCPFRQDDVCILMLEEEVSKNCSCEFQRPPDCPLNSSDIWVIADDNTRENNT